MEDYRVDLDIYKGPLDLLLYLVRKSEVEIEDIPIAMICDQYIEHLEHIKQIDLSNAGDFILMAATLMDIKSRMLVPSDRLIDTGEGEEIEEGAREDPRADLVRELLEYKRYRDRAHGLEKALKQTAQRVPRPTDPSLIELDEEGKPLREPTFGELVRAFIQVVRQMQSVSRRPVRIEDVPLKEYIEEIVGTLSAAPERSRSFFEFFKGKKEYGRIIGLFLAILELAKERKVRIEQIGAQGDIFLVLRPEEEWIRVEVILTEEAPPKNDEPLVVDPESRITPKDKLPPGWVKTEEGYIYTGIKETPKPQPAPGPTIGEPGQQTGAPAEMQTPVTPDGAAQPATPSPPPPASQDVTVDAQTPAPADGASQSPFPEHLKHLKKKKETVEDLISEAENFDLGNLDVEEPEEEDSSDK
ncbi:MAG: segregation and condensation protein A [Planctomycetota bacterium]|jgi:segregation and condensation protein A